MTMPCFNTEQGLALSSISCCVKDNKGILWFGTGGGGCSRYDGKKFQTLNTTNGLINNIVYCIFQDSKGNYWFGTDGGVSFYNGRSFVNFTTKNGLPSNQVRSIVEDDLGNVWLGTDGAGVCYFDGHTFKLPQNNAAFTQLHVNCLAKDSKGTVWVGTDFKGLFFISGKAISAFASGVANEKSQNQLFTILSLFEDQSGRLWIGQKDHGAICLQNGILTAPLPCEPLKATTVNAIVQDRDGNLWFCTHFGIYEAQAAEGEAVRFITTKQGLANNFVSSATEDNNGNLWFGTYGGGISRFDGDAFSSFTTNQGVPEDITFSIAEDKDGRKWFGTNAHGPYFEQDGVFHWLEGAPGLNSNTVFSIIRDHNGSLWFGTDDGLYQLVIESTTAAGEIKGQLKLWGQGSGLPKSPIFCMTEDRQNRLWLGTCGAGLVCIHHHLISLYGLQEGLTNTIIRSILNASDGTIWLGTSGGGLNTIKDKQIKAISKVNELINPYIYTLTEDHEGVIWAGTGGGISKIKKVENGNEYKVQNITLKDGLPDLDVFSFTETKNKEMIAGTNKGMVLFHRGKLDVFGNKTGYPVKDANSNALFCDHEGIIWEGTGDKLIRFDYSKVKKNHKKPQLWLEKVLINEMPLTGDLNVYGDQPKLLLADTLQGRFKGVNFSGLSDFYPVPRQLVLPYRHNSISFEVTTNETSRPFMVKYQFFLEGYDADWSPPTDLPKVDYGNMHEGKYVFKARACSADGVWGDPLVYRFKVLPPWFRTWWMYLLYGVGSVGLFWFALRWRTATLRRDKERLRRLVGERTAEVVLQKDEAERQRELVFVKNKEITDSINYAQRIQNAMLKPKQNQLINIPENFILLKPKDIVSGDFYWTHKKDNFWYIAAVDCTGHGVPGAFMSMLGLALLNEIINREQVLTPAEILDALRFKVIKELQQGDGAGDNHDGMDMSLARIQLDNNELQWAGANNSIYIINSADSSQGSERTLVEIKGDKQPIGFHPSSKPFTNNTVQLTTGTLLYLFTDGFADQFGGAKGKKLLYKRFEQLLLQYAHLHLEMQKKALEDYFELWKKEEEQVDDVCLIGINI